MSSSVSPKESRPARPSKDTRGRPEEPLPPSAISDDINTTNVTSEVPYTTKATFDEVNASAGTLSSTNKTSDALKPSPSTPASTSIPTLGTSSSSSSTPPSLSSSTSKDRRFPLPYSGDPASPLYAPFSLMNPFWHKAPVWGQLPTRPMRAHTATLIEGRDGAAIWVFGGCDQKNCFRDVWKLDLGKVWTKPKLRGAHPPSLRAHSATYIPPFSSPARIPPSTPPPTSTHGHILVFGGGDGPSYFNDTYLLDLARHEWSKPAVSGHVPSPRRAHTAVWYEAKKWVVLFGGGNGSRALNDTLVLDCADWEKLNWVKLDTKGAKPRLRGYHTMNLVGDKVVVFGGSDGVECFSDVFVLDLDTLTWSQVALFEPSLHCPRLSHSSTLVSPSHLLILGGHDGTQYQSSLVLFDMAAGQFAARQHSGMPPSERGYHSAVAWQGKVVLLGGYDGKHHFDDTWVLEVGVMPELMGYS
ncbi:MAG: hypothetical protein CYPHOPRED_003727 [Cyphobasidiales sp. Tagirdzhanova-0007]|nr:MAG: hypothetical protein CYPHOPRED_003727 [Cyphobasidiales sp. Tagirdzhanova-0007]